MQDDKAIGKIKPIPCDTCPFWLGMMETLIIPCSQCKHRPKVSNAEMLLRATNPWLWKRVAESSENESTEDDPKT